MKDHKPMLWHRPVKVLILAMAAMAAFALTRLSAGATELAAWFVVAFCAGGLVSLFQRRT